MTVEAILAAHEGHATSNVSMSWGWRVECDDCAMTLGIWNEEGDLLWKRGDKVSELHHYLRGRDYYEAPK